MRVVVAPDKFKGSLSSVEVASAIQRGFAAVYDRSLYDLIPIADGGEGTADAFHAAMGGEMIRCASLDALGRKVDAGYFWCAEQRVAVIDMSAASGLWRLKKEERNPLRASTYGTGLLVKDALTRGVKQVFIGLGGSATNDGGCGMAAALGWKFADSGGNVLDPTPEHLQHLHAITSPGMEYDAEFIGLADVKNPLLGERGASAIYGPQKGADTAMVTQLEGVLKKLADVAMAAMGHDRREVPGAGAAGGLGFGILTFLKGKIEPGFEAISELIDLESKIATADLVLTGEGKLDHQTLEGKGPAGVAEIAKRHGKPVVAFGGAMSEEERLAEIFTACFAIANRPMSLEESEKNVSQLLELAATRVARVFKAASHS